MALSQYPLLQSEAPKCMLTNPLHSVDKRSDKKKQNPTCQTFNLPFMHLSPDIAAVIFRAQDSTAE